MQRTNLASLLVELRNRDLTDNRLSTEDKRSRQLYLTAKGKRLLEKLEKTVHRYETDIAKAIDPQRVGVLQLVAEWLEKTQDSRSRTHKLVPFSAWL